MSTDEMEFIKSESLESDVPGDVDGDLALNVSFIAVLVALLAVIGGLLLIKWYERQYLTRSPYLYFQRQFGVDCYTG